MYATMREFTDYFYKVYQDTYGHKYVWQQKDHPHAAWLVKNVDHDMLHWATQAMFLDDYGKTNPSFALLKSQLPKWMIAGQSLKARYERQAYNAKIMSEL